MKDEKKTREQLIEELEELRRRISTREASGLEGARTEDELIRLSAPIRMSEDIVAIIDLEGKLVDINETAAQKSGLRGTGDFIGRNVFDLVAPSDRDRIAEYLNEFLEKGSGEQHEYKVEVAGGGELYLEVNAALIRNGSGKPLGLVCIARDISERKRAEGALRESEEKFRLISEQSMMGIIIIQDSVIKYLNQAAGDIHGYGVEVMTGMEMGEFIGTLYEEDRAFVADHISRHQLGENESMVHEIVRIITPAGKIKWVDVYAKSIIYQSRRADLVTITDITEHKRADDALRESENTLRALLDGIDETALLVDPEGTIIIINETGARRLGVEASRAVGKNAYELMGPDAAAIRKTKLKEAADTGRPTRFADQRNGMHLENTIFPSLDPSGKVSRLAIFARDVTEHIKMEEELLVRSQELEAFAHTISHDLRSPLTLITGYAQTAQNAIAEGSREAEEESLEGILKAVRRMDGFIDTLLEYARSGHPEGKAQRVDPAPIIGEALEEQADKMDSIGARIEVRKDLPVICVDPIRFHQVIANLLENALKFMGDRPNPRVEIGAEKEADLVTWWVRDNGMGIPPELQEHIFELFRRLSISVSVGLGIGLATVKRVVEAWGGRVWVESVRGEGSTFFFTTPTNAGANP
jgi:PAS domain S-box-containing protein